MQEHFSADIPEDLSAIVDEFISSHPDWTTNRIFVASLALFMAQKGDRKAAEIYLNTLHGDRLAA